MTKSEAVKIIKSKNWEVCVSRPGFLQSKKIVLEAETTPLKIASGITIKIKNDLWIDNTNIFLKQRRSDSYRDFEHAFRKEKKWPRKIYEKFKQDETEVSLFIDKLKASKQIDKMAAFIKYKECLVTIQKYYSIAEMLADYCEKELQNRNVDLSKFAYPICKLDIEKHAASLEIIKKSKNKAKLIKKHLKEFGWILTGYNIIKVYKETDLLNELKGNAGKYIRHKLPKNNENYLLESMQIAIYMRNRIKELSQQLWFFVDPLAISLAKDIGISRGHFFQLTHNEAIESITRGRRVVPRSEIEKRNSGLICGFLDGKEILITGKIGKEMQDYFREPGGKKMKETRGYSASGGVGEGEAKIILTQRDFPKFNKGDILIAPMTTIDYIVLMKKAGAFVTDEGGLSCHAAIIAREMKKPCIIGTKIATKVLRDGDLVEVDADKGVVKILKRKKI
jgi:phosphohistidine swiveling domain-containing protein